MNYSKTCIIAFLAGALVALSGTAHAKKPKPKTEIKFATLAPDGSTWMKVMRALDEEVREATENRVGFKFYPGGVQGDEKNVLRKIRNGQLHAGGFTGMGLGAVSSELRVMELPFMFRDLQEVDYVRGELDDFYKNIFHKKGYTLLGWADVGFVYIFSNTPIRSPEELRAAKVWTWSGDRLAELFFKAFEVSPIPLEVPNVLTSLQMGVVNAVYAPPMACIALQWFTRVKYMSNVPITYGFGAMLVSNKALNKISPEDLATLKKLSAHHSQILIDRSRKENIEAVRAIKDEGVEVLEVDAAMINTFFVTGRKTWKDGVGHLYPAELLERVSAAVETYRSNQTGLSTKP